MAILFRGMTSGAASAVTSIALAVPGEAQPGDLLLFALHVSGGTGTTITPPSGWELVLRTDDTTNASVAIYRRRKTTGLVDPVTFTFTSANVVAALLAYGGADQVLPVDMSAGQANASSTSCTAPSVTTTRSNDQLVGFFAGRSGAVTATPPAGWTERVDTAGAALALMAADNIQATAGASGTKVATLSSATANIGAQVALFAGALNMKADVRDEGNWRSTGFSPQIANDTEMDAFVEGIVQRANAYLRQRVGADAFATNILADPWYDLFKQAEMHFAQMFLLEAAAQIAETGDDTNPAPFLGTAEEIRRTAARRLAMAEEILLMSHGVDRPGPQLPYFRAAETTPVLRDLYSHVDGIVEQHDDTTDDN